MARIAAGVPGRHHLVTSEVCPESATDPTVGVFESVVATGGSLSGFGWSNSVAVADAVRLLNPDVVHFHGGPLGSLSLARVAPHGCPAVVSLYLWSRVEPRVVRYPRRWVELLRAPALAPRTWVFTALPTSFVMRVLQRSGMCALLVHDRVAYGRAAGCAVPAVMVDGIVSAREMLPAPDGLRFVFAGRAEFSRGADVLADAVALLRGRGVDVSAEFFLLGSRSTDAVLARLDRPGCSVHVGPRSLPEVFAGATAVVLPFRFDSTTLTPNMVAAEAMSFGVPVVGSDVACLRGIVEHGVNGLLVGRDNPGELADMLLSLSDRGLLERLKAAAFTEVMSRWESHSVVSYAAWAYRQAVMSAGRFVDAAPGRHQVAPGQVAPGQVAPGRVGL